MLPRWTTTLEDRWMESGGALLDALAWIDESVCESDLGEVGKHAKEGIGREFMHGYRD